MVGMGSALAAGMSPELTVKGQMAVPSCGVTIANEGVFDLGKISNGLIRPNHATELSASAGAVKVDCEAETFLNFTVVDNREGTASTANTTNFGLGNVNGSGKLGYYRINLLSASVDGKASSVFSAVKGSSSFTALSSVYVDKNKVTGWAKGTSVQSSGKKFAAVMQVEPMLASSASMGGPITDNVKLDGSATLNFAYGI
ncbi:DUF1120 domain-containing protein [Serratia ureilytica]|nr:DUF1120 domain-containing protein [Serratia ureilytica]MBH3022812.1 DUF1120 domain-containing protein [Serratia ureilytica]MBH3108691.1 DUF1120 domain-containing protein [Serratia ureilytica]MBH3176085.1 DUF1120 domain-containing protein [Serratia ureilytica]QQU65736.1 DUF1120 domain-containing protein [Serratia ureilytica]